MSLSCIAQALCVWPLALFWSAVTCVHLAIQWFKHRETFFQKKDHPKPAVLSGWTHGTAELKEVKLHYVESGDFDKPLMVMVHGFPEFWYSWRHQIKYFEKDYHVVAVDMRGYNESEKPEEVEKYQAIRVAHDIKELIESLNYKQAIIIGHDWGGAIVWRVAMFYPEVVERLIVCNCPHPLVFSELVRTPKQLIKSWYMFMFQMPWLPEFAYTVNDYKMLRDTIRGKNAGIKNKEKFTDEDMEAWLYSYSRPGAFTGPINFYRAIMQKPGCEELSPEPIKAKTLIVWGTEDMFLQKEGAEKSANYCEMAQIRFVNGASHWVQQDCPELVNEYIHQFLNAP